MNCQKFEQVVGDLARGRMMEADVRAGALAHSEDCGVCSARLRDEGTLTRGLQMLAVDLESLSAPPEIEFRLREALRQRQVVVPLTSSPARRRYWWAAVAAMLLIAMTVAAVWWRSAMPRQEVAREVAPKAVENPKPAPVPAGPSEVAPQEVALGPDTVEPRRLAPAPKSLHRNSTPRLVPETQLANHINNEIATDFMPLGDLNPAVIQDGGQIVRVKLRRSTLARFGLPVNMERYNENVKADVLVGSDGLAHAIRFVQ
jgi:hypothetical protein